MRRRILGAAVTALLVGLFAVPSGGAQESTATATITALDTRTITTVDVLTFAGELGTDTSVSGAFNVVVAETAAAGVNPWSVTGRLCGPTDLANPSTSGSDCTTYPDQLARSQPADGVSLPGANFTANTTAPTVVDGGGTASAGSGGALSGAAELLVNTGQDPDTAYTGTYTETGTIDLDLSNVDDIGTFSGYWVVTLVQ